ncbi:MAG: hypothetical protein NC218_10200 [Acetobacter sp.]|nr:hypothetical protein [Acetobacter sp.]
MKEKLSVRKVYRNAYRYVVSHWFAFLFLTVFYFLGSLLPMIIGDAAFKIVSLVYTYLFFYFAAGCYYKQQILWDKHIFMAAGVRFLAAIVFFLTSIVLSTVLINVGIYFFRSFFPNIGGDILDAIFGSALWLIGKYAFIFVLFAVFFIVPSFAFVSEITGKNRSLLTTYAKTKGNLWKIGGVAFGAFFILMIAMFILSRAHFLVATITRAAVLVYISILYFKMYDFFYGLPQSKRLRKKDASATKTENLQHIDVEGAENAN